MHHILQRKLPYLSHVFLLLLYNIHLWVQRKELLQILISKIPKKKILGIFKKAIDKRISLCYNIKCSREWRNRQTRTFEGRVSLMYGFKSRFPHQQEEVNHKGWPLFVEREMGKFSSRFSNFSLKTIINRFLNARHFPHKKRL